MSYKESYLIGKNFHEDSKRRGPGHGCPHPLQEPEQGGEADEPRHVTRGRKESEQESGDTLLENLKSLEM